MPTRQEAEKVTMSKELIGCAWLQCINYYFTPYINGTVSYMVWGRASLYMHNDAITLSASTYSMYLCDS